MIKIRFHGRGGHGIKTASRIVGTAAFLSGYQVQDSPVYGAERRGAAVAAFTRISEQPILERGVITRPDLIVIGDETLLDDPSANVLLGHESAIALFINAEDSTPLAAQDRIRCQVVTSDITLLTLQTLGRASALSAGLGSVAARLTGIIDQQQLLDAIHEELEHVQVAPELITKNKELAGNVFGSLEPVMASSSLEGRPVRTIAAAKMHSLSYADPLQGAPSILHAGNASQRQTGNWRFERPEIDYDRCTRCGICFVRCPDGAIALDDDGYPVVDYDHCKGCMICWDQCPVEGAILKKKETRAW